MKKNLALTILIFLLTACASPTPAPTPLPASSSAAAPSPAVTRTAVGRPPVTGGPGIAVATQSTQKNPNGEIVTTAKVTAAENVGLGQIDLAYPEKMIVGESRTVRLKLSPAQQLAGLTPVPVPQKTPDLPGFVYKFGGNIDLYPVMIAELRAVRFQVQPTGAQRRNVDPTRDVLWDWVISPTTAGQQALSLELSIPAVINGVTTELTTDVIRNIAFNLQVDAPPPPSPGETIYNSIINNAGAIVVALIGLIGTLIGIYLKMKSDDAKATGPKT
jgi:hypothetical protein